MKTPKKPITKSQAEDPEDEMEDSIDETTKDEFVEDEDDFDVPLDDLETFDAYSADDDDDDY
ncbi:MAG: hypothetical protein EOO85_31995 [Pedobacter sp.]|jgi:hypothetical protein|nr:MAG: hypothetical protein EOO85_31995 [Pedobacter sp.]